MLDEFKYELILAVAGYILITIVGLALANPHGDPFFALIGFYLVLPIFVLDPQIVPVGFLFAQFIWCWLNILLCRAAYAGIVAIKKRSGA